MVGVVPDSPQVCVSMLRGVGVYQVWVHAVASSRAPWYPCSTIAYRVAGLPGYFNSQDWAEENVP